MLHLSQDSIEIIKWSLIGSCFTVPIALIIGAFAVGDLPLRPPVYSSPSISTPTITPVKPTTIPIKPIPKQTKRASPPAPLPPTTITETVVPPTVTIVPTVPTVPFIIEIPPTQETERGNN